MLQVNQIDTAYDDVQVLFDVSLNINEGELVAVIGANGAGKTTLLKTISGMLRPQKGSIIFQGKDISVQASHRIVADGIVHIPEGRLLFPKMTIRENLMMGAYLAKSVDTKKERIQTVFELFPKMKERENQLAGTLSGGEQQMLAIGRGLMAGPTLLMLDEPSLGLAPKLVVSIFEMIEHINHNLGITVLLIEQNVRKSCEMSDRAYVLENGHVVLEGMGEDMLKSEHVKEAYLGL